MEILRSDAVRWGLTGVLVLFLAWLIRAGYRWFSTSDDRDLERQLQEALADGDNKKAGDIQVRRGNLVEASRIFVRSGEHGRAGNVLEMLGQTKQAAEEYEKASEWSKAGPLFKKTGEVARAAACLEKSSERADRVAAAECWALAKEPLKAARIFQDVEEFERAAEEYAKLDDLDSPEVALTMLENAALAAKDDKKKRARLWLRAGELGVKLGAFERAARAYDEGGELKKAADIYENALKKLDLAAALYAEAGDQAAADRLAMMAGGAATVLETRAARARARGDAALAASLTSHDGAGSGKDGAGSGKTAATVVRVDDDASPEVQAAEARNAKRKGEQLGERFELMGELGRGGMGIVYRAKDVRLGRFVALKFLPEDVESGSKLSRLFRREARAAAALTHPGIVTVYDVGELDGREFIAMEMVEGTTLDRVLDESGPLGTAEALELMEKVLEAIEYAHGQSVIHRDLKPANLMRTKTGIKIMDFGLAKIVTSKSSNGQTVIGGTPNYMPPEQSTGHADHRSDVFALGVTFYELLTGVLPGRPGEPASIATDYPTPRERTPSIPARLSDLVMHCLERERDARAQDVVSVLRELREIRADLAHAKRPEPKREAERSRRAAEPTLPAPTPKAAAEPTPQRKALPARIAREEEDDDAPRVERVERLGPTPKGAPGARAKR